MVNYGGQRVQWISASHVHTLLCCWIHPGPKKKFNSVQTVVVRVLCQSVVSVFNSDYSLVLRNNKSIKRVCVCICIYAQVKKLFVKLLFYGRVNLGLLDGQPTCFTILTFYFYFYFYFLKFTFTLLCKKYERKLTYMSSISAFKG